MVTTTNVKQKDLDRPWILIWSAWQRYAVCSKDVWGAVLANWQDKFVIRVFHRIYSPRNIAVMDCNMLYCIIH